MKILRQITKYFSLLAIVLFLFYDFRIWIPHLEYQINKKYIAENLCENRNKPEMHCNGKCHLKKQIKKAAEREPQTPTNIGSIKSNDTYFVETADVVTHSFSEQPAAWVPYSNLYSFEYSSDIFAPPKF